jgi:hypothetical protein
MQRRFRKAALFVGLTYLVSYLLMFIYSALVGSWTIPNAVVLGVVYMFVPTTIVFMGGLQPRMEMYGCLFAHVEPWLAPEKIEDLWYFEGLPETTKQVARSFAAVPNRLIFVGLYHRWLLAATEGLHRGVGDRPIVLARPDGAWGALPCPRGGGLHTPPFCGRRPTSTARRCVMRAAIAIG